MDINPEKPRDSSENETRTSAKNRPVYYAHFRVAMPEEDNAIVEEDIRETVVNTIREVLERKHGVHDGLVVEYRFEVTTDWIGVI